MFTAEESSLLHRASEQLVAGCMAAQGLRYLPVPDVDHSRSSVANPYGLLNAATVNGDGYGMTSELLNSAKAPQVGDLNDQLVAQMTEPDQQRWRQALTGTAPARQDLPLPDGSTVSFQTDGCVFQAKQQIYGPAWDRLFLAFQAYANLIMHATTESPAYKYAMNAWSNCMRAAGYSYRTLNDPREDIAGRLAAATQTAAPTGASPSMTPPLREVALFELHTAQADLKCEDDVGLGEAIAAAQNAAAADTLPPSAHGQLDQVWSIRHQATNRARALLGNGHS